MGVAESFPGKRILKLRSARWRASLWVHGGIGAAWGEGQKLPRHFRCSGKHVQPETGLGAMWYLCRPKRNERCLEERKENRTAREEGHVSTVEH